MHASSPDQLKTFLYICMRLFHTALTPHASFRWIAGSTASSWDPFGRMARRRWLQTVGLGPGDIVMLQW